MTDVNETTTGVICSGCQREADPEHVQFLEVTNPDELKGYVCKICRLGKALFDSGAYRSESVAGMWVSETPHAPEAQELSDYLGDLVDFSLAGKMHEVNEMAHLLVRDYNLGGVVSFITTAMPLLWRGCDQKCFAHTDLADPDWIQFGASGSNAWAVNKLLLGANTDSDQVLSDWIESYKMFFTKSISEFVEFLAEREERHDDSDYSPAMELMAHLIHMLADRGRAGGKGSSVVEGGYLVDQHGVRCTHDTKCCEQDGEK